MIALHHLGIKKAFVNIDIFLHIYFDINLSLHYTILVLKMHFPEAASKLKLFYFSFHVFHFKFVISMNLNMTQKLGNEQVKI